MISIKNEKIKFKGKYLNGKRNGNGILNENGNEYLLNLMKMENKYQEKEHLKELD